MSILLVPLLVLYVLPAAYAASKVGPHYGFLAGCATMAGVLAAQTILLTWGAAAVKRRRGAVGQPEATVSAEPADGPETDPEDEPAGASGVQLRYGERARFKQLVLIAGAPHAGVARRFYDKAKQAIEAFVEVDAGRDGSGAAMVRADELAPADGLSPPADETLTVFVSDDGAWSGFRAGDDSFRFRHGAITGLRLTMVMPVRWNGDYMVTFRFDVPKRGAVGVDVTHSTWFDLGVEHSERRSRALVRACREIASVLDVAFDVDETGDD